MKKRDDLMVILNDGLLGLVAKEVSVINILEEITNVAGIEIWVFDDIEEKITMDFKDIKLKEGLNRILKNKDFMGRIKKAKQD